MAIRTDVDAVKLVISTSLSDTQINAFIADASLWVDEELASGDYGLSADRMELIERYLTCALIRTRDLGLKNAKMGDVSEQYQVDPEVTDYLMRAASFDPTGQIRRHFLAPKNVRTVKTWRGKTFNEEADEDNS